MNFLSYRQLILKTSFFTKLLVATSLFLNFVPITLQASDDAPSTYRFELVGNAKVKQDGDSPASGNSQEQRPSNLTSIEVADTESEVIILVADLAPSAVYTVDTMVYADALGSDAIITIDENTSPTAFNADLLGLEDGLWHHLTVEVTHDKVAVKVDGSDERRFESLRDSSNSSTLLSIAGIKGHLDQLTMTTQYRSGDGRDRTRLLGGLLSSELAQVATNTAVKTSGNTGKLKESKGESEPTGPTEPSVTELGGQSENVAALSIIEDDDGTGYILTNAEPSEASNGGFADSTEQGGYAADQFDQDESLLLDSEMDDRAYDEESGGIDDPYATDDQLLSDAELLDQYNQDELIEQQLLEDSYANNEIDASSYYEQDDYDQQDLAGDSILLDDGEPVFVDDDSSQQQAQTESNTDGTGTSQPRYVVDSGGDTGSSSSSGSSGDSGDGNTPTPRQTTIRGGITRPISSGSTSSGSTGSGSTSSGSTSSGSTSSGSTSSGSTSSGSTSSGSTSSGSTSSGSTSSGSTSSGSTSSGSSGSGSSGSGRACTPATAPSLSGAVGFNPESDGRVIGWYKMDGDWRPAPRSQAGVDSLVVTGNPQFDDYCWIWTDRPLGQAVRVESRSENVQATFSSELLSTVSDDDQDKDLSISISTMLYIEQWSASASMRDLFKIENTRGGEIAFADSSDGPVITVDNDIVITAAKINSVFLTQQWHHVNLVFTDTDLTLYIDAAKIASVDISDSVLGSFENGDTSIQLGGLVGWFDELLIYRTLEEPVTPTSDGGTGTSGAEPTTDGGATDGGETVEPEQFLETKIEFSLDTSFEESNAATDALGLAGRVNFDTSTATATSPSLLATRFLGQGDELYTTLTDTVWEVGEDEQLSGVHFEAKIRVAGFNNDRRVPLLQLTGQGRNWFGLILEADQRNESGEVIQYGGSYLAAAGEMLISAEVLENVLADEDWHVIRFNMTETECSVSVDDDRLISRTVDCEGLIDAWQNADSQLVLGNYNGWMRDVRIETSTRTREPADNADDLLSSDANDSSGG